MSKAECFWDRLILFPAVTKKPVFLTTKVIASNVIKLWLGGKSCRIMNPFNVKRRRQIAGCRPRVIFRLRTGGKMQRE